MIAEYDKVIIIKDDNSDEIKSIIVHDTKLKKKLILNVSEKSMDEIITLFNRDTKINQKDG